MGFLTKLCSGVLISGPSFVPSAVMAGPNNCDFQTGTISNWVRVGIDDFEQYRDGYVAVLDEDEVTRDVVTLYQNFTIRPAIPPGPEEKGLLAREVEAVGGAIVLEIPNGYLIDALLTLDQILLIADSDHLLWLNPWSEPGDDMDIVRDQ